MKATDGAGERLDRFELVSEIASGGMATVYLARLTGVAGFQRLFAIKRLHPHLAKDPDFVEMFLDEARLAARIHHPNVVGIQEVGQNSHGYYLVMDYVEGATLGRILSRAARAGRRVPADVVIRILLDMLAGLHAAHEMPGDDGEPLEIVHRDISPQNILLGVDGVTRLTDFGVARAQSKLGVTKTGQLKGKLAYMAPEQARGAKVDRRADLFATGIVLWEGLALRRLFKGESDAEVLNRVLHETPPLLRTVSPSVPRELEEVVAIALARDPDDRYPTAAALADALEAAAKQLQLLATPRDVARFMQELIGDEIAVTREELREVLLSGPRHSSSAPSAPVDDEQELPTRVESQPSSRGAFSDRSVAAQHLDALPAPVPAAARTGVASGWRRLTTVLALGIGFGLLATVVGLLASRNLGADDSGVVGNPPLQQSVVAPPAVQPVDPPPPASTEVTTSVDAAPTPAPSASASGVLPKPVKPGKLPRPPASNNPPPADRDIGRNPYRQ